MDYLKIAQKHLEISLELHDERQISRANDRLLIALVTGVVAIAVELRTLRSDGQADQSRE
jgi:hypothetical protein